MFRSVMRALALVCGILLALPSGWCCLLRPSKACTTPNAVSPAPDECCCGCRAPKPPAPSKSEPTAPRGPLDKGCCCADRRATDPADGKAKADPGLACCFALPVADEPLLAVPPVWATSDRPFDFHSPPVNLLNCVWLC